MVTKKSKFREKLPKVRKKIEETKNNHEGEGTKCPGIDEYYTENGQLPDWAVGCKFYKEGICRTHCNINDTELWSEVNLQHEPESQFRCDRQYELFYYDSDSGQYKYINIDDGLKP